MMVRAAALVIVLTGASVGSPAWASHCEGGCVGPAPTIAGPRERVALDGVLVFPGLGWGVEVAFKHFTVTVRDAGGEVVAGALELPEGFSVAIWRPAAPWLAGARHTVTTSLDVVALVEELYGFVPNGCPADERVHEIEVAAEPLPPGAAPPLIVEETHVITERRDLDSLVCCDEAFPRLETPQGHCSEPDVLRIDDGSCASLRAVGRLQILYAVEAGGLPEMVAGNLATRLADPGVHGASPLEAWASLDAPACLRFEVLDLARGELFVEERCHGDDVAGQLGELEPDPTAELAAACAGEPYVCERSFSAWDPTTCRPWPDHTEGCGCRVGVVAPAWVLLTLLLGLGRRRVTRR